MLWIIQFGTTMAVLGMGLNELIHVCEMEFMPRTTKNFEIDIFFYHFLMTSRTCQVVTTFVWHESFTICTYVIVIHKHTVCTNKYCRVLRIRLRRFIAKNLLYENWHDTCDCIGCVRYRGSM